MIAVLPEIEVQLLRMASVRELRVLQEELYGVGIGVVPVEIVVSDCHVDLRQGLALPDLVVNRPDVGVFLRLAVVCHVTDNVNAGALRAVCRNVLQTFSKF